MPKMCKVTRRNVCSVKPGDRLYYNHGRDLSGRHCEAYVIVVSIGTSVCEVHVDRIATQEESSKIMVGQEISANWNDLRIIRS